MAARNPVSRVTKNPGWSLRVLLVFALLRPVASLAAEEPLTLERAVQLALERNTDLRRLENQVTLGEASVRQAAAQSHPNLNLSVSPAERFGRTFDQSTGQVETDRNESLSLRASSSVSLFDGYANEAALKGARLDLEASRKELEQARQRIAYETASRFLDIFAAQALIRVEQENLAAQRQQLERIRAYWEQGTRSRTDVLQQEAALASAELRLVNVEQSRQLAVLRLEEMLQIDPLREIEFTGPSLADLEREPVDYRAQSLVQEALAQRPELEGQQRRIQSAEEQIRQARAGRLPKLSLSADAGTSYSSANQLSDFTDQMFDLNPNATVGLSLSIPIFDQAQTQSSVARARVQLENERLSLENLEQQVSFAVQQALLDYRTALEKLAAAAAQKTSAAEALTAMETRYNTGAATFVELSQTRAQHVDAQGTWVQALYDITLARLAVEYYRGGDAWQLALRDIAGSRQ